MNVAVTGGNVTNRTAQWTYTFNNSALYASGTYGGVGVNNGRVTYTAANSDPASRPSSGGRGIVDSSPRKCPGLNAMRIPKRTEGGLRATPVATLLVSALGMIGPAFAGTVTDTSAPYNASTPLNHQIVYPRFLRFRVGAPAAVSLVNCDLSAQATVLGTGTDLACAGGDAGGGVSNVEVKSNAGQVNVRVTTAGALLSGANSLPFSEIKTASNSGNLPAPVLPAAGGTSANVAVVLNAGVVTDRSATWTYTFDNTTVYASGTYGGVNANNGRVT